MSPVDSVKVALINDPSSKSGLKQLKSGIFALSSRSLTPELEKSNKALLKYLLWFLCGGIALATPAAYFMLADPMTRPNMDVGSGYAELSRLGQFDVASHFVRWDLWVCAVWCEAVTIWFAIPVLPTFIVHLITRVQGVCSENTRDKLGV